MKKIMMLTMTLGLLCACNESKNGDARDSAGAVKVGAATEARSVNLSPEIEEVNETLDPKYEMEESELSGLLADGSISQEEYDELIKLTK